MSRWLLVLAITLGTAPAQAHVAPSVDDNNRYIKLTPLGDRVRLAYTVFFGEIPGKLTRATLDTNHDGTISDAEGQAFGTGLAAEVAAALDVAIDGKQLPIAWAEVSVGMGTPDADGGAFSVDLVAWLCLPSLRGKHQLLLHDRFQLTQPGETEIKVDDAPGVAIEHGRVGHADDPSFDYKFVGPGGPLADDGLDIVFVASDSAPVSSDATCADVARSGNSATLVVVVIAIALVLGGVAFVVIRRR
jgi:hypothetical protein